MSKGALWGLDDLSLIQTKLERRVQVLLIISGVFVPNGICQSLHNNCSGSILAKFNYYLSYGIRYGQQFLGNYMKTDAPAMHTSGDECFVLVGITVQCFTWCSINNTQPTTFTSLDDHVI